MRQYWEEALSMIEAANEQYRESGELTSYGRGLADGTQNTVNMLRDVLRELIARDLGEA